MTDTTFLQISPLGLWTVFFAVLALIAFSHAIAAGLAEMKAYRRNQIMFRRPRRRVL